MPEQAAGAKSAAMAVVRDVLAASDLPCDDVGDDRVMTLLVGDHKRTIGVLVEVGDRTLAVTSLFTTTLDGGHREVYELVLHRNERSRHVHFALDDVGHLVLVGRIPLKAHDHTLFGEVLGELLNMADSAFNAVLRAGFADYLATEQAWRMANGLPPNPVGKPTD